MPLFTSVPAGRNSATPYHFRENGNSSDIPATLSEVNIVGTQTRYHTTYAIRKEIFQVVMKANATKEKAYLTLNKSPFMSVMEYPAEYDLIPLPQICVKKPSEKNVEMNKFLRDNGFTQEDYGETPMVTGKATIDIIDKLSDKGADTTINTPVGKTNIAGWHTGNIVNRMCFWAIKSLQEPAFPQANTASIDSAILQASRCSVLQYLRSGYSCTWEVGQGNIHESLGQV